MKILINFTCGLLYICTGGVLASHRSKNIIKIQNTDWLMDNIKFKYNCYILTYSKELKNIWSVEAYHDNLHGSRKDYWILDFWLFHFYSFKCTVEMKCPERIKIQKFSAKMSQKIGSKIGCRKFSLRWQCAREKKNDRMKI